MSKSWPGFILLISFASALASSVSGSETVQFSSGEDRVALIELFTSEGCSSCPPADQWLSDLQTDHGLWRNFVPIAFHVDYWDYIGWQDPYANRENSDRQRRYARDGGVRFVYTPGFLKNGKEWLAWRDRNSVDVASEYGGSLDLLIDGNTVTANYDNTSSQQKRLNVHIAVLGMNVSSDVRSGENRGRLLKHDFVALNMVTTRLARSSEGFQAVTRLSLDDQSVERKALVAWVSADNEQTPLQAVGGFLPAS